MECGIKKSTLFPPPPQISTCRTFFFSMYLLSIWDLIDDRIYCIYILICPCQQAINQIKSQVVDKMYLPTAVKILRACVGVTYLRTTRKSDMKPDINEMIHMNKNGKLAYSPVSYTGKCKTSFRYFDKSFDIMLKKE